MESKNFILGNIKKNIRKSYDMPDIDSFKGIQYPDKLKQFIEISKGVGGDAVVLQNGENLNDAIKKLYPEAKNIASNLPQITIANLSPDTISDPHELNGVDLGIIAGELGVAENGCVWIPQNVKYKAIYFVSEYLVIVLDKNKIVNNMHEAYSTVKFSEQYGFSLFISGPSKTADIEQSLVMGAHGAKGVTVVLT
jgi:L-lactate dehydrogenase complex protein LldG